MKCTLLCCFLGVVLFAIVEGVCPPMTFGNCTIPCTGDAGCSSDQVCCATESCQSCVDPANCSNVECQDIICTPPSVSIVLDAQCCSSCANSYCTSLCRTMDGVTVGSHVVCENARVFDEYIADNASSCEIECFYSNITDALHCATEIRNSSMIITSITINQSADETLESTAFANVDLPSLMTLNIINGRLQDIEDGAFNVLSLRNLSQLDLSGNSLTELVYANFVGLDNLERLYLGNNSIRMLDEDLETFFMGLQAVILTGNSFACDCCLEWLIQCDNSDMFALGAEYCSNLQELSRNVSIMQLTSEDFCPSCPNGTFRSSGSCNRNCAAIPSSSDDYYDLDFEVIVLIGAAAGIVVTILAGLVFCLFYRCCCKKKHRRDNDKVKLMDNIDYYSEAQSSKTIGFRNRLTKRFFHKEVTFCEDTDTGNGISANREKTKKKIKKRQMCHENIYDLDEADAKFEAFYSEEVTMEELQVYANQLSVTWYELGQRLGLDTKNLDTIKLAIGNLEGRCVKMLEMWKNAEGPMAHDWGTFLSALKSGQSSTEHQIADEIYNIRCINTLMHHIYSAIKDKQESTAVWESWNFILTKAEESSRFCKTFLKVKGLDLLLHCTHLYTSDWQLKAVIFHILDAMAKFPELQSYLMRSDVMYACKAALGSSYHPILSFTAGSIVSRMAIEGEEVWGYIIPNMDDMLYSLSKAIGKWDINHRMEDEFARGFQKLDYLVTVALYEDSRIAHWGIWALANHCKTNGSICCVQLRQDGHLAKIENLMQDAKTAPIRLLCSQVIHCCEQYNNMETHI